MSRKVALVTGAAKGLGRSMSFALAQAGFDLVLNTRVDFAAARAVAGEINQMGVDALPVVADVADAAAVAEMVDLAMTRFGGVHVLVNNAALRTEISFEDLTLAEWRAVHEVILEGAFSCISAVSPSMRKQRWGRIINIVGARALAGDPARVHLSAAKYGLIGLTRALARAYDPYGITVNAVSPGSMRAETTEESARRRSSVASAVTFLASEEAAGVSGQLLSVGEVGRV